MDETEFRKSMRLGLGRAILFARGRDLREWRDAILDACLHCYSYDIQVEGSRASYMYDLVGFLPDKAFYFAQVLNSLAGCSDKWDAAQRFDFAACLASDGNQEAKRAMYDGYNPGPSLGELVGVHFVRMDGIKGLLFVAEKIGALIQVNPQEVDEGYLLSKSLEICGEQATWDALRDAGATNPRIEAYRLAAAESNRARTAPRGTAETTSQPTDVASLSYAQLFAGLPHNKPYLLWKWGEGASAQELELAAQGLLAAKDSKEQLAHLRIFARRRFPLDVSPLLPLAEIEEHRVGLAALKAFAQVRHPAVRDLAFRLIDIQAKWRGEVIELLSRNHESGDHLTVLRWFDEEEDLESRHSMGMDLPDFWKEHPDDETEIPMLQSLYENGPCSCCRGRAVRRLIEREALTQQQRAECAWDANDEIRELVS